MPVDYSGKSLVKKLGIKPDSSIDFVREPSTYLSALGELPEGVKISPRKAHLDLVHLFAKERVALENELPKAKARTKMDGAVWVSWPKKSSKIETDLSDAVVREVGLANGLVDVKVCTIDESWSGLKFVRRLKDRCASSIGG